MNKNVLKKLLAGGIRGFKKHLVLLLFVLSGMAFSLLPITLSARQTPQSWVLKGNVVDETDKSIPGVSIIIKNKTRGTTTDIDGNFIIEINDKTEILVLSYTGYKTQEINVGDSKLLNVKMLPDEEKQKLNEVVVVGFGTQKKVSVTGAISTISVKDIERSATPSLSNALGGKLPGIITKQNSGEPGFDQASIFIRGMASLVNNTPLILIDGVERDLNTINPQEIESFYILKDASATAVYGVRGANGVVIITTRKGIVGKPVITFRTETAMLTATRVPDYINGPEYAGLINEALKNGGQNARFSGEDIQKFQDGSDPYLYPNVNWIDEVLRKNTYQSITNLNVTGGTDLITYFVNVGYDFQNGLYKGDSENKYNTNANLNRYNFRSRVDMKLSKSFSINLGVGGNFQHRNYPANPTDQIFNALQSTTPIAFPMRNPDGTPGGVAPDGLQGLNPFAVATQQGYKSLFVNSLQTTFGGRWDLSSLVTKGLSFNNKFAYDNNSSGGPTRGKFFQIKQYLGKDPLTGEDKYIVHREEQPLSYSTYLSGNRSLYFESSLNYDRAFGKHELGGLLLYNQSDYGNITAATTIANLPSRHQGAAGRLTYGYDNRYFTELNFGYNGSENFPKGKRFGFFPSISAGWVISNEKFWNIPFINNLKIRGSHGQSGNDQTGTRFLFLTTLKSTGNLNYYYYGLDMNQILGIEEDQTGNDNITWEVSTKTNMGLDMGLFNDLITLQVDLFKESRKGILIQRQDIPSMPGFFGTPPYGNLGRAKNQGVDGQIEIKKSLPSGLFYSFRGNLTYARNTVIENDEPLQKYAYQSAKGQPIGQTFGLVALDFFKDQHDIDISPKQTFMSVLRPGDIKYQDVNGDGVIDLYDRVPLGYPRIPEIMYGFGGTVAYKGFDVSIFFTGAANSSFFMGEKTMQPFNDGENNIMREYYDNRWIPGGNNVNAKYPAVIDQKNDNNFINGVTSTLWYRDGSYLRLKNAEIGFTLPSSLTKKISLQEARFFVNGLNLYTWDKVKIADPETDQGDGGYPIQRTVNLGIQVKF